MMRVFVYPKCGFSLPRGRELEPVRAPAECRSGWVGDRAQAPVLGVEPSLAELREEAPRASGRCIEDRLILSALGSAPSPNKQGLVARLDVER
jgi:hypothetical protein